nr:SDR family oxidoreductase [Thermosipho globiformans]
MHRIYRKNFKRLDVIINNAAISNFKNFLEITLEEWEKVIKVNLTGYFLITKYGVPLKLKTSGKGSIINIASTRAIMSEKDNEAYSASKAGILGLTHALANSLGPNIRVNTISPGWILHKDEQISQEEHMQHLVGRAGTPNDILELALFLADEKKAGFITGQNIVIDGGITKKMIYI